MVTRTNRVMIPVLIVAGLASERALAVTPVGQTIDPPSPGLPLSYGDTGGLNIGVQNNTTVHGLSVNASSTWIGQNFYGLSNTAGNTIDTGGFTVNTGSKVYGSSSGIQNASGATISASAGSGAITNFGSIGFIGMTHSEKGLYNNGVISATGPLPGLTNRGEIRGYTAGILNDTNGTIYGGTAGIQNATGATIGAVTLGSAIQNLGTIGSFGGAFSVDGIYNDGTITGSLGATIYNKGGDYRISRRDLQRCRRDDQQHLRWRAPRNTKRFGRDDRGCWRDLWRLQRRNNISEWRRRNHKQRRCDHQW